VEIGIVIVVVVIVLFIFISNGFKTRCPQCGAFGRHPKDVPATEQRNEASDLLRSSGLLDQLGGSLIAKNAEKGFHHDQIRCVACGHLFDRSTSIQWHGIARKIGDEKAIAEYKNA
jgi:predicted  nucleic acid-binding Zn-ribbon protein